MILLDTDHLTVLKYRDTEHYLRLATRLSTVVGETVGIAVITVEEQMRGWLAAIAKEKKLSRQVGPYGELAQLFEFFSNNAIIPFDDAAVAFTEQFGRIHIGLMDKKIAAIAISNDALLLTANRRDFERFPGLGFENWMDAPPNQ